MFNKFKKNVLAVVSAMAIAVMCAVPAFATDLTVDFSGATTGLYTQAQAAITAALPVLGALLGVSLAIKLYKRFTGK